MGKKETASKSFCHSSIEGSLNEIIRISGQVQKNGHSLRVVVSPSSDSVRRATGLDYVLDVEGHSFFYNEQAEALLDQSMLYISMRKAGLVVLKSVKSKSISLKEN